MPEPTYTEVEAIERATLELSTRITAMLMQAECDAPSGCYALAIAYGMWFAEQPEATAEYIEPMMGIGAKTARRVFELLRRQ